MTHEFLIGISERVRYGIGWSIVHCEAPPLRCLWRDRMTVNECALILAATAAFYECDHANGEISIVYIKNELLNMGMLDAIGGVQAISELIDGTFSRQPYDGDAPKQPAGARLDALLQRLSGIALHPSVAVALLHYGATKALKTDLLALLKKETVH